MDLPGLMLWAWQRPENLNFIDTNTTGVAFLAGTARIANNGSVQFEPLLQALSFPPGTSLLAVVRIESKPLHPPVQTANLLARLKQVASMPGVRGLQIDYDARASERPFYRAMLKTLSVETTTPVGITALASWCAGDRWLDQSPIAEAVPMFFQMGKGEYHEMRITSRICGSAIGLSTEERWPSHRPRTLERIYLFSPRAWTQGTYAQSLEDLKRWH